MMSISKSLALIFLIFSPLASAMNAKADAAKADVSEDKASVDGYAQEFDGYIDKIIAQGVPGAAVVIVAEGKLRFIKGYGVRRMGAEDPITVETIFPLASVSKTFASSAVALLVQEKMINWDSLIRPYLNQVDFKNPGYGHQITLQNLLSHTTGLVPHAHTNLVQEGISYERIVGRLKEVDFICAPGKCYSYQNIAFSLVGDVVKSIKGETYEEFVTKSLFIPLGMKNASFGLNSFLMSENHAIPHVWKKENWSAIEMAGNFYNLAPAAGANASIEDMGKWLLAQLGYRSDVLYESTLDALHKRAIKTTLSQAHYGQRDHLGNVHYGLGWRIFDFGDYKDFIHHGGWIKGIRTEIVLNRKLKVGMAFLANSESRFSNDVVFKFLEFYENSKKQDRIESQAGLESLFSDKRVGIKQ
jgi:beta-lactamase class C